jgi:hypothetical protein
VNIVAVGHTSRGSGPVPAGEVLQTDSVISELMGKDVATRVKLVDV